MWASRARGGALARTSLANTAAGAQPVAAPDRPGPLPGLCRLAPTIHSYFVLLSALTATVLAATLMFLGVTTARMDGSNADMVDKLQVVRATEELWGALLYHEMRRRAFEETGNEEHLAEVERMQRELGERLDQLERMEAGVEAPALLAQLILASRRYLAQPAPEVATEEEISGSALERERLLLMAFSERQLEGAQATLTADRRWSRFARNAGVAAVLLFGVALALGVRNTRRNMIAPLNALNRALLRFQPGVCVEVAPETGVEEVRNIARVLNQTARRLEHQRESSLRFVAGVAHDLRNPLQALKLSVGRMKLGTALPPEDQLRARFALIDRPVDMLNRMVGDLLDATRIESGELSLSVGEHDLGQLAHDAVEIHRPSAPEHTLVLERPDAAVVVTCDQTRISQVLNNLLNNAIKYSPDGGSVRVEVGVGDGRAWVAVTDFGIGVPPTELKSIFEPFRRSSPTRGKIPGVGLGLSVARRIADAHGGTFEVESQPGQGSTFRVLLPVTQGASGLTTQP